MSDYKEIFIKQDVKTHFFFIICTATPDDCNLMVFLCVCVCVFVGIY